jgi:hypothetical protein
LDMVETRSGFNQMGGKAVPLIPCVE